MQEYFAPEAIGLDGELISFGYHDLGGLQSLGGVRFGLERAQVVSERFKLRLNVVRRGSELELEFGYDSSRMDRKAVERIAGYYQNLLAAAVANPETAVARLPLLSEETGGNCWWSGTRRRQRIPRRSVCTNCLSSRRRAIAGTSRGALRRAAFTYRELNERANQLAHYLRGLGVGPDRPVGLCLERSAETMVAVLAILKAGGAYVPLNPDNPPARLLQQLQGRRR